MEIINFAVHLMSGATLLLFAVRFMRVGIERLWNRRIRRSLSSKASVLSLLAKGACLGFAMQGATVVMLMAAGLAGSSTIPLLSAGVLAIGADLGSALVVSFLTLPVGWISPVAILLGGWLYLNSDEPERRTFGRIILGLGLILLSLSLIRQAVLPLQQFPGAATAMIYLNSDHVTAAILGIAITLLMHSSLAAVLTFLAFAAHGDLDISAGLGLVVGCNIGSALLPLWLLRGENGAAIAVAKAVAGLRICLGLVCLGLLGMLLRNGALFPTVSAEHIILLGHAGFNLALLFLVPLLPRILGRFSAQMQPLEEGGFITPICMQEPEFATIALKGQVNRMLDLLAQMFDTMIGGTTDPTTIALLEARLNRSLADLRCAYSQLPDLPEMHGGEIRQLMDFAIRIEACGDILCGKCAAIQKETLRGDYTFSDEGVQEIAAIAKQVRKGFLLAQKVFWGGDLDVSRELVIHKQHVSDMEIDSKCRHLTRVRKGISESLGSSDGHLESIAALKAINSKLATIGYAVLGSHGKLSDTRLMREDSSDSFPEGPEEDFDENLSSTEKAA